MRRACARSGRHFPSQTPCSRRRPAFRLGCFPRRTTGYWFINEAAGSRDRSWSCSIEKGRCSRRLNVGGAYGDVELSRDGRQASVSASNPETNTRDVWIVDLQRGVPTRFTFDPQGEQMSIWAPDSSRLIYNTTNRNGKFGLAQQSLNAGTAEDLLPPDSEDKIPWSWSPDGQHVLFSRGSGAAADIWLLPMTGQRTPVPLLQTAAPEFHARFDPSGRWIAYTSADAGRAQVYVVPFPGPGPRVQALFRGRAGAALARRRQRAVLLSRRRLADRSRRRSTGASFQVGEVSKLFTVQTVNQPRSNYAVTPDGQQFVVNAPGLQTSTSPIVVVMNWLSDLQR